VCPLSNVLIANSIERVEDHPWPAMAAAGLHLTLNSDDPAFIDSDLGAEYAALAAAFGYDLDHMVGIAMAGVEAAWLEDGSKADLQERVHGAARALGLAMAS
jgi:adenosine deaminase